MNLTIIFLLILIILAGGVAIGFLFQRKWKKLYHRADARVHELFAELQSERAAKEQAQSEVETLQPLAEMGARYKASQDRHNEKRKAARAEKAKAKA